MINISRKNLDEPADDIATKALLSGTGVEGFVYRQRAQYLSRVGMRFHAKRCLKEPVL